MNRKALFYPFFSLLIVALALSACGGSKQSVFPSGKFIKSGETNYGLEFKSDGAFQVFQGATVFVHGTYKVEGDTLTETSNDGGCKTNISFKYSFDGQNLTLKYADNPDDDADCTGRYADFNNVTYTLAK